MVKSVLKCKMLDNCWGIHCCIDFEVDFPLMSKPMAVSIPIMFRYDPCEYFIELVLGPYSLKEWFLEYDWGKYT